jgi:hypothetical protein
MPINIDYSTIDFDALKEELINYLKETKTYKDVEFANSNINTLVGLYAYLGSLFGYYINATANEPFLPSAKRYKNLNRIARLLAYNPRGDKASTASVVGALSSEYCFGKEDIFFEIPAYSLFPANKPTPIGENFSFTNINPLVYLVRSFGVRAVEQTDFSYKGLTLPLTKSAEFWLDNDLATFDPTEIILNLSDTLPLSVLDRLDPSNFKGFDENVPLFDGADSSSVGQPFNRNIEVRNTTIQIQEGVVYYIVFNYDTQTSSPYLSILEEGSVLESRRDDVITSIRLERTDADGTFFTLKEVQNNAKEKFYVGVLGMKNLEALTFDFTKLESTTFGIKQIHMDINKSGDKPPFQVLIDGVTYTFNSGRLSSQIFPANSWDASQPFYNINLTIVSPDAPQYNYDATLTVTSKDPGVNEVTIARIYPPFVDQETDIQALKKEPSQRFGNLQIVPVEDVTTTEQKSGTIQVEEGITKMFIAFDIPFVKESLTDDVEYIIQLTPSDNVQIWFSDKNEEGFSINIEENTGFSGTIDWIATRFKEDAVRQINIDFDDPIPQIDGEDVDYTVFLTASDNVKVWYTDKTSDGFKINTEKQFNGTVSYSTFIFSENEQVAKEKSLATQRKGTATFSGSITTRDITFDGEFDDNNYGLHMIANQNVNVWYTNKSSRGFTINVEQDFSGQVVVDWFADQSALYEFQKHGMVTFSGQVTTAGTLPGLRFTNISETFLMSDLKQGAVKFSHINRNGVIDISNNRLGLQFAADRKNINEIKVQITESGISYSDIRTFVKNEADEWEEWADATSLVTATDIAPGQKVFFVRVDEYKNIEISFGNGETFGSDPVGKEMIIFGLKTVGQYGNVVPNTVGPSVVLSKNILGDDDVTVKFEDQFVQLLGLKSQVYFAADEQTNNTTIYDSEGTKISDKELVIKQPVPAAGGAFTETTEELRSNAGTANLRQDRVVSKEDYRSFCEQAFNEYIIKTQVLSYKEIKEAGILPAGEIEKYWFNYLFIVALPKFGNVIPKTHRDFILSTLDTQFKAMSTVEHELVSAKLIPIDIRMRLKKGKTGNAETIQTTAKKLIREFFDRDNHEMGETIEYGSIAKLILNITNVSNAEIAFNRDDNNSLGESDYDVDAVTNPNETVQDVKRRKVLELLAKDPSLLTIVDPLFDIKNTATGERTWVFSQNLTLNKFEFPILGDIIIEMEN